MVLQGTPNRIVSSEIKTGHKMVLPEHLLCAVPGLVQHTAVVDQWLLQLKEHLREVNS